MNFYLMLFLTLLVAIGRLSIPSREVFTWPGSYEAIAHIWVGILIALAFFNEYRQTALWLLVLITVFEIVMSRVW